MVATQSKVYPLTSKVTTKKPNFKFYTRHRDNWRSWVALTYIFGAYGLSIWLITTQLWWLNLIGILCLTHSLVWGAFFLHEFFHYNIFSQNRLNEIFGKGIMFLLGTCYCRFKDLATHHIAHHVRRADFSPFHPSSMTEFLKELPTGTKKLFFGLEFFCIPAVNYLFRWMIALAPFLSNNRQNERQRNCWLLLIRGGLFTLLACISPLAIVYYFIAYSIFLNYLQFVEGFQHTYTAHKIDGEVPAYSLEYEEANTFSYPLRSLPVWVSTVLFLNNNYHNAHHRLMSCPWYLIPQLDEELYQKDYSQYLPLSNLLLNYFRFRVLRLYEGQGTVQEKEDGLDINDFRGATGMSILTLRNPFDWLSLS